MQNNLLETNTNNWKQAVCCRKHERLTSKQQECANYRTSIQTCEIHIRPCSWCTVSN